MTTDRALRTSIRRLYDDTTPGWLRVWGDHLHHGHYGKDGKLRKDPVQAQVDMIDELLAWASPPPRRVERILDAGCGVGGSARHLATRFDAEVRGITLSPVQREIAETLSGSRPALSFEVADATATGYASQTFDLVWALESLEHMPCKAAFLSECARLLRPGGMVVAATWCHRPTPPTLSGRERHLLDRINWSYADSLAWVPLHHYETVMRDLPFTMVRTADWTSAVLPFWAAVLRSVITPSGLRALASGGRSMWKGAFGGLQMRAGLERGLVRYGVLCALKAGPEGTSR